MRDKLKKHRPLLFGLSCVLLLLGVWMGGRFMPVSLPLLVLGLSGLFLGAFLSLPASMTCPVCGRQINARAAAARGAPLRCPRCGTLLNR